MSIVVQLPGSGRGSRHSRLRDSRRKDTTAAVYHDTEDTEDTEDTATVAATTTTSQYELGEESDIDDSRFDDKESRNGAGLIHSKNFDSFASLDDELSGDSWDESQSGSDSRLDDVLEEEDNDDDDDDDDYSTSYIRQRPRHDSAALRSSSSKAVRAREHSRSHSRHRTRSRSPSTSFSSSSSSPSPVKVKKSLQLSNVRPSVSSQTLSVASSTLSMTSDMHTDSPMRSRPKSRKAESPAPARARSRTRKVSQDTRSSRRAHSSSPRSHRQHPHRSLDTSGSGARSANNSPRSRSQSPTVEANMLLVRARQAIQQLQGELDDERRRRQESIHDAISYKRDLAASKRELSTALHEHAMDSERLQSLIKELHIMQADETIAKARAKELERAVVKAERELKKARTRIESLESILESGYGAKSDTAADGSVHTTTGGQTQIAEQLAAKDARIEQLQSEILQVREANVELRAKNEQLENAYRQQTERFSDQLESLSQNSGLAQSQSAGGSVYSLPAISEASSQVSQIIQEQRSDMANAREEIVRLRVSEAKLQGQLKQAESQLSLVGGESLLPNSPSITQDADYILHNKYSQLQQLWESKISDKVHAMQQRLDSLQRQEEKLSLVLMTGAAVRSPSRYAPTDANPVVTSLPATVTSIDAVHANNALLVQQLKRADRTIRHLERAVVATHSAQSPRAYRTHAVADEYGSYDDEDEYFDDDTGRTSDTSAPTSPRSRKSSRPGTATGVPAAFSRKAARRNSMPMAVGGSRSAPVSPRKARATSVISSLPNVPAHLIGTKSGRKESPDVKENMSSVPESPRRLSLGQTPAQYQSPRRVSVPVVGQVESPNQSPRRGSMPTIHVQEQSPRRASASASASASSPQRSPRRGSMPMTKQNHPQTTNNPSPRRGSMPIINIQEQSPRRASVSASASSPQRSPRRGSMPMMQQNNKQQTSSPSPRRGSMPTINVQQQSPRRASASASASSPQRSPRRGSMPMMQQNNKQQTSSPSPRRGSMPTINVQQQSPRRASTNTSQRSPRRGSMPMMQQNKQQSRKSPRRGSMPTINVQQQSPRRASVSANSSQRSPRRGSSPMTQQHQQHTGTPSPRRGSMPAIKVQAQPPRRASVVSNVWSESDELIRSGIHPDFEHQQQSPRRASVVSNVWSESDELIRSGIEPDQTNRDSISIQADDAMTEVWYNGIDGNASQMDAIPESNNGFIEMALPGSPAYRDGDEESSESNYSSVHQTGQTVRGSHTKNPAQHRFDFGVGHRQSNASAQQAPSHAPLENLPDSPPQASAQQQWIDQLRRNSVLSQAHSTPGVQSPVPPQQHQHRGSAVSQAQSVPQNATFAGRSNAHQEYGRRLSAISMQNSEVASAISEYASLPPPVQDMYRRRLSAISMPDSEVASAISEYASLPPVAQDMYRRRLSAISMPNSEAASAISEYASQAAMDEYLSAAPDFAEFQRRQNVVSNLQQQQHLQHNLQQHPQQMEQPYQSSGPVSSGAFYPSPAYSPIVAPHSTSPRPMSPHVSFAQYPVSPIPRVPYMASALASAPASPFDPILHQQTLEASRRVQELERMEILLQSLSSTHDKTHSTAHASDSEASKQPPKSSGRTNSHTKALKSDIKRLKKKLVREHREKLVLERKKDQYKMRLLLNSSNAKADYQDVDGDDDGISTAPSMHMSAVDPGMFVAAQKQADELDKLNQERKEPKAAKEALRPSSGIPTHVSDLLRMNPHDIDLHAIMSNRMHTDSFMQLVKLALQQSHRDEANMSEWHNMLVEKMRHVVSKVEKEIHSVEKARYRGKKALIKHGHKSSSRSKHRKRAKK
jgi:hypothetical protein